MKKTHLAALIVFAAILSAVFAVSANAQWWNDNPFSDVSSDSWYYDAGRSETTLAPLGTATRAEACTIIIKAMLK